MKRLGGTFSRLFDDLVRERVGLAPSRRHEQAKERVLGEAMKRAGVTDEAVYLALLKRDDREFDALIADLTVPETYFFRDPPHYELLRREVLPALVLARGREHVLEVWSAGCATGEEPYSLAMLLEQELLGNRSHVLGTDVSQRAIERARRASYGRWSMRATEDKQRERWFLQSGREYRVIERIRERVRFQQHSLMSAAYPRPHGGQVGFDLILCRNVMIYFGPETVAQTAQRLASQLAHDGWLMMGPSDPLLEIEEWCDTVATPCGLLYHRRPALPSHRREGRGPVSRLAAQVAHGCTRVSSVDTRSSFPPSAFRSAATDTLEPRRSTTVPPAPAPVIADNDPHALARQVQALVREHGVAAAEAGCRDLVAQHPLSAPVHLLHATLLFDLGRDHDAELSLRRALYLDRSLLVAQMLSATLAERRLAHTEAVRSYEQVAVSARAAAPDERVPYNDELTHAALADLAEQRARALQQAEVRATDKRGKA